MKHRGSMADPGPALNKLFARLERRYYRLLAWHGIASIFLMLAATAAISFILDSVFELDKWLRVAVIIVAVALWVRVLLQGRRRLRSALSKEDLLAAVENSSEDLEGELANIVELRRELAAAGKGAEPRTGLEQELFDRALRESQQAVSALEVGAVLDAGSVRKNQLAAVAAVLFLVFCGFLFPVSAGLWVQRNIALSSVHWPRATHFFLESSGKVDHPRNNRLNLRAWVTGAPRGGDVFIVINSESGTRKSRLLLEIPEEPAGKLASEVAEGAPDSAAPFKASRLNYTRPNVPESFEFYFVGGDNQSKKTRVIVHDKPRIVSSRLRVRAPEHTGRGEQEILNPTGEVEVIAGSKVIFEGSCDREIRKAWGRFGEDEQSEAGLSAKDGFSYSFAVESSAFLEIGVEGAQWGFDSEQVRLAMVAVPDAQPEIELKIAGEAREVTPNGRIEYTLRASDDFGFSQLQLLIDGLQAVDLEDGKPKLAELPPWEVVRTEEGVVVEIAGSMELATLALEPGMNISFRGLVRDNDAPGGYKESSSEEITFAVVSTQKLKENLDKVRVKAQERLEELTFREGALGKELLRLQEELSESPPVSAGQEGRPGQIAAGGQREEGSEQQQENGEQEPVELALAEPSEAGNPAEGGRNPGGRQGRTSQGGRQASGRQGQNNGEQSGENASEEPGEGEEPGEREPREGEEPGENEENGESEPGRGQQQAGSRQGARGGRQGQSGQSSQGRQGQAGEEGESRPEDGEEGENEAGERSGEEEENGEETNREAGDQPRTEQGESETPEGQRNSAGTGRRQQQGQQGRQQEGQQGRQQQGQQGRQQEGQQGRQQQGQQGRQQEGQQGRQQQGQQGQQQEGQQGRQQQGQQGQQQEGQQGSQQQGQQGQQQEGQQGSQQQRPQNDFDRLSREQEGIANEARDLARSLREMADDLERNQLMERSESERFEEEVARPLEELGDDRLPRSAEDIEAIPRSGSPQDEARRAEAEARKISRNLRDVSRNLAGSGDFREILQRLESIVELQGKVISETRDATGTEDSAPQKGSGGKKDK